jgi:hypothetical protein
MAPNHLMLRLVSPSEGLINNSGPNWFEMHTNMGQISKGGNEVLS